MSLTDAHKSVLMRLAWRSIDHGLDAGKIIEVDCDGFDERLRRVQASFVTLHVDGRLRGCVGGLEAWQPLAVDVSEHAYLAAFSDARFTPLGREERAKLCLHVSVLSAPEPMPFSSEADLLARLRPHVHGLTIEKGNDRATFLPAVWESLPQGPDFLAHLKDKAGIDAVVDDYRAWRYTAESFGEG